MNKQEIKQILIDDDVLTEKTQHYITIENNGIEVYVPKDTIPLTFEASCELAKNVYQSVNKLVSCKLCSNEYGSWSVIFNNEV